MASNKKHVFTLLEKKFFLSILKKYKVIENKKTDGASVRAKNYAWMHITREFNASPYAANQANDKQLRRLWMNLKHRHREALRKKRLQRVPTSGPDGDAGIDPDVAGVLLVDIDEENETDPLTETTNIVKQELEALPPQIQSTATTLELSDLITSVKVEAASEDDTSTIYNHNHIPPSPSPPPIHPTYPSISMTTALSAQSQKNTILDKEYEDKRRRADQLHELQLQVERERLKEAKAKTREAQAKAELAEFVLAQKRLGLDIRN